MILQDRQFVDEEPSHEAHVAWHGMHDDPCTKVLIGQLTTQLPEDKYFRAVQDKQLLDVAPLQVKHEGEHVKQLFGFVLGKKPGRHVAIQVFTYKYNGFEQEVHWLDAGPEHK